MADYILALDQGTTSSRAILFDRNGGAVRSSQSEFRQYYPRPGWVEHDAQEIWASQLEVARSVVDDPAAIAAIGISNQRETTVIWERETGEPIHNAIVWQDRRTAALCDELKAEGFDQTILERTGLVTDAYFSATKVAWLLENVAGAREKAEAGALAFGTDRQLSHLEAHWRPASYHRCQQRGAHHVIRYTPPRLGRDYSQAP